MSEWDVNWTGEEREVIKNLALEHHMPIRGIIRQAMRLYQFHIERLKAGETCSYSGDAQRAREFAGDLLDPTTPQEE